MKSNSAMGLVVAVSLVTVIVAVVWAAFRGQRADQELAGEIDRGVMADYCRLVGEARYAEAWERCLTTGYRHEVGRDAFVAAHERRRAELGALRGCRLVRADVSRNLFSGTRDVHLLYELAYPGRSVREYAKVSDADGDFRLEGTYHLGAADTYDFLLW